MIIKASERGGGKQLGLHLMNAQDNEHVTVHEIRGFLSSDVVSAFKEAYAVSKGTKCKNFMFSVSFNPPETEQIDISIFEDAISRVEERNGLSGQPRVIVVHEKEGRRHAHAVWSRIDAETMTAKQLSNYKYKCMDVSKEMFLENDWDLPAGMIDRSNRDPRNFTLEEWQQAKRAGYHARDLKQLVQESWNLSDSRQAFASALEERGMKLAKGDRRGHVVVTYEGEVFSVARYAGKKAKEVRERLGDENALKSVDDTKAQFAEEFTGRFEEYLKDHDKQTSQRLEPLNRQRQETTQLHRTEREKLQTQQQQRWDNEVRQRSERLNSGIRGLWDRVSGQHKKTIQRNERAAYAALKRDQDQRQHLVQDQLSERQALQTDIKAARAKATRERLEIYRQLDRYRKGQLEPKQQKQMTKRQDKPLQANAELNRANPPQAPPRDTQQDSVKSAKPEKSPLIKRPKSVAAPTKSAPPPEDKPKLAPMQKIRLSNLRQYKATDTSTRLYKLRDQKSRAEKPRSHNPRGPDLER